MAYWRIAFTSRTGKDYEIRIDGAATGEYLTGAPNPITIAEDTSRDIFKPVRLQTGYVRFIDTDGTTWKDVLPTTATDRPVYLYDVSGSSDVLVWQGYLKPEVYKATLGEYGQVIELPIVCELSTIGRNKPSVSHVEEINNLAYLLYMIFGAGRTPTSPTAPWWEYLYIQGGNIITTAWLKFRPQWGLFYEEDNSNVSGFSASYNWLELLKHVCTFFGWSCRTYGRSIYLCALDDPLMNSQFVRLSPTNVRTIANGGSLSPTIVQVSSLNLGGATLRFGSSEELLQGINSCEVVANIGRINATIDVPWGEIQEEIKINTINKTLLFGDNSQGIWKFQRAPEYFNAERFGRFIISSTAPGSYVDGTYTKYYEGLFDEYQIFQGSMTLLRNYDLENAIYIKGQYPQDQALVSIETIDAYNFQNGILVLSGKTQWMGTSGDDVATRPANGELYVRIHVGDYVYNGSYWEEDDGTDSPWLIVGTGTWPQQTTGTGTILNTRNLDDPYPAFDGFGMPVGANIGGKVKIEIKGFSDAYGSLNPEIWISGLRLEFLRSTSVPNYNERDENRYTASSGKFLDNVSVETIFASDNGNAAGRGIVLYNDGRYLTTVPYGTGSTLQHPEQRLANRMATMHGAKTHSVLLLDMLDGPTFTPSTMVTDNGKTYATVSISKNVEEDENNIILVEI